MNRMLPRNEYGIALVIVIWVLALLTVIAAELSDAMRMEVNIVRNFKESTQAQYIAQAGLNQAILTLIRRSPGPVSNDENTDYPISGPRLNIPNAPQPFADGAYVVQLDNAGGWVNLNQSSPDLLKLMLAGLQISAENTATIIDSILDWRDSDDFHRLNGAENDYYKSLPNPYTCKNADFSTVAELRLVKGVTPELYEKIAPMVIVLPMPDSDPQDYSSEADVSEAFGLITDKISINAAPAQILAILPSLGPDQIERIRQYRTRADFRGYNELAQVIGPESFTAIEPFITLALSPYYHIRADGRLQASAVTQSIDALIRINPMRAKGYEILARQEGLN